MRARWLLPAALALAAAGPGPAAPVPGEGALVRLPLDPLTFDQGGAGLGLALRRLGTVGRVLYVTAHPDDEDNAALVALSRGRGLRVTLLSLTRGAGGLNELGPELFHELSVLRTAELDAVHRYDGVAQRFGLAGDFGYSYSVEESLARWGPEPTLADLVAVIREVRPDIVLTLPLQEAPGGSHHSASARLALEAFRAAGDPARFPELATAGRRPWQPRKLYQGGVGGPRGRARDTPEPGVVPLDTAVYDPLLGMTWAELGSLARARHLSQGTSPVKPPAGEGLSQFLLVEAAVPPAGPERDLLDGLDLTLGGLAAGLGGARAGVEAPLRAAEQAAERARSGFDAREPHRSAAALQAGLLALREGSAALAAAELSEAVRDELASRLEEEEEDFGAALALALGLAVEASAETAEAIPGQTLSVTTRVWNPGPESLGVEAVSLAAAPGWSSTRVEGPGEARLAAGQALVARHALTVAADAAPTQPHWHSVPGGGRDASDAPATLASRPWLPPAVSARVRLATAAGPLTLERPVSAPRGAVEGPGRRPLGVVPALSVRIEPPVVLIPLASVAPRPVRIVVRSHASEPGSATVRLEAPASWRVRPPQVAVSWSRAGEEVVAAFSVAPPAPAGEARAELHAVAEREGRQFRGEVVRIDHPHLVPRPLTRPASAPALVLPLRVRPRVTVGYVRGTGDVVAEAISSLGVPVEELTAADLAQGDLGRFGTIVLGVRAYHARPDLRAHNRRLLAYAEDGGHVVVQLSRAEFNQPLPPLAGAASPAQQASPFAPFPLRVGTRRVSDETAPVSLLLPAHPLLSRPNRIGAADFAGWVQERGSFLAEAADSRYRELLSAEDPWPQNAGARTGLLVEAPLGRGTWTYVGINLFRQLAVGTPGAYRLLANLVSRPRDAARPAGGR